MPTRLPRPKNVALIALFIDALSMSPQKYHFNAQC
jgi:hypothetical protein